MSKLWTNLLTKRIKQSINRSRTSSGNFYKQGNIRKCQFLFILNIKKKIHLPYPKSSICNFVQQFLQKKRRMLENVSLYFKYQEKKSFTLPNEVRRSQVRLAIPTKKKRRTLENVSLYFKYQKKIIYLT